MDIHFSGALGVISAIFSYFKQGVEKALFYRAYEISTIHHSHRQLLGRFTHNLTSDLEYDIHYGKYYLRNQKNSPIIWIRATHDKCFSKLVLSVTASNDKIKYQDTITFLDVGSVPVQAALPSIPFRKIRIKDNRVYTPYDHIVTKIVELYDDNGQAIRLFGERASYLSPIDRLEVAMGIEKGDVEKWGEVFNLQFIEMEIREERIRLARGRLNSLRPGYNLRKLVSSQHWIVKANFWRKNLFFANQLTLEFKKYWQEQKELDQWRLNNKKDSLSPRRAP